MKKVIFVVLLAIGAVAASALTMQATVNVALADPGCGGGGC